MAAPGSAPPPPLPLLRAEAVAPFAQQVRKGEAVTAVAASPAALIAATDHGHIYIHEPITVRCCESLEESGGERRRGEETKAETGRGRWDHQAELAAKIHAAQCPRSAPPR